MTKTMRIALLLAALSALPDRAPAAAPTPTAMPEGVFVPIAPCRIYRSAASGQLLPANTNQQVYVTGPMDFSTQGGPANGCGIPVSATAVAVSLTTSHASSAGTLAALVPGATSSAPGIAISFTPAETLTTGLIIGVRGNRFTIEPVGGSTNATVDITGYFAPQIEAVIDGTHGTIYSGTARVLSVGHNSVGNYTITIDRDVSTCEASLTMHGSHDYGSAYTNGSTVVAETWLLTAGSQVDTDLGFDIGVHC